MSRGMGSVETAILTYLLEQSRRGPAWRNRLDVITFCLKQDGRMVHPESVRRAMKTLEQKGFVELGGDNGWRLGSDGEAVRFWETSCPTARLSAEYLSTLKEREDA